MGCCSGLSGPPRLIQLKRMRVGPGARSRPTQAPGPPAKPSLIHSSPSLTVVSGTLLPSTSEVAPELETSGRPCEMSGLGVAMREPGGGGGGGVVAMSPESPEPGVLPGAPLPGGGEGAVHPTSRSARQVSRMARR